MESTLGTPRRASWQLWAGRVISAIPVLLMCLSASLKFRHQPAVIEAFSGKLGYPESMLTSLGILEVFCLVVYLVPQTAVLGAILLTGYLGGAISTHLRVGDPIAMVVLIGVLVWAGLYLREDRLRALLPIRILNRPEK